MRERKRKREQLREVHEISELEVCNQPPPLGLGRGYMYVYRYVCIVENKREYVVGGAGKRRYDSREEVWRNNQLKKKIKKLK